MSQEPVRIRLEPCLPTFWRRDGSLQIGYPDTPEAGSALVFAQGREVATWLRLFDGSRDWGELLNSARAMGLSVELAEDLLHRLLAGGLAYEVETLGAARAVSGVARDLQHAAAVTGRSVAALAVERSGWRALVVGAGPLPYRLQRALLRAQVDCGWQPLHPGRIRPEDAAAGELEHHAVGRKWQELARRVHQPQLVVAVADAWDLEELSRRHPGSLLLPVVCHRRRIAVGPLLHSEVSLTASRLQQLRAAADPDWDLALTQLLHEPRPLPVLGDPWLGAAESLLTGLGLQLLAGSVPAELVGHSLELLPPEIIWRQRDWSGADRADQSAFAATNSSNCSP